MLIRDVITNYVLKDKSLEERKKIIEEVRETVETVFIIEHQHIVEALQESVDNIKHSLKSVDIERALELQQEMIDKKRKYWNDKYRDIN